MKNLIYGALCLVWFCSANVQGQSPCYDKLYVAGKTYLEKGDYAEAFEHFIVARNCWDKKRMDRLDYYIDLTSSRWTAALEAARKEAEDREKIEAGLRKDAELAKVEETRAKNEAQRSANLNFAYLHTNRSQKALENNKASEALCLAYEAYNKLEHYNHSDPPPEKPIEIPAVVFEAFGNAVFATDHQTIELSQTNILAFEMTEKKDRFLTIGRDSTIKIWSISGQMIDSIKNEKGHILSATFSSKGNQVLICNKNNTAFIWKEGRTSLIELQGHENAVVKGAFINEKLLITISRDGMVKRWNESGNEIGKGISLTSPLIDMIIGQNKTAYFRTAYVIYVLDLNQPYEQAVELKHDQYIFGVALSPDEQRIMTVSADRTIKLWSGDGKLHKTIEHDSPVYTASFNPLLVTNEIVTGSQNGEVRLMNLDENDQTDQYAVNHTQAIHKVIFSPNGNYSLSVLADASFQIFGKQKASGNHRGGINDIVFSPDSQTILSCSEDQSTRLWASNGDLLMNMPLENAVLNARFYQGGNQIISITKNGIVYLAPNPILVLSQIKNKKRKLPACSTAME
nr:high-affnity carbon uptake protein Hat-HatR [uncultured bacterium]